MLEYVVFLVVSINFFATFLKATFILSMYSKSVDDLKCTPCVQNPPIGSTVNA